MKPQMKFDKVAHINVPMHHDVMKITFAQICEQPKEYRTALLSALHEYQQLSQHVLGDTWVCIAW